MTDPQAPPRRLTRSTGDRVVAGVCGGLGDFTGLDPVIFRVVFAVATILGGAGLLAYVIAWLVVPEGDEPESHAQSILRGHDIPRIVLAGAGVVAALIVLGSFDGWGGNFGGGGIGLLIALGVGLWLWNRSGDSPVVPPVPPTPPLPPPPPPLGHEGDTTFVGPAFPPPPVPPIPPVDWREYKYEHRRRRRSKLTQLTFGGVLLTAGVLAAIDAADIAEVQADTALAICLLVVGAGLLVGSVYGRRRGLVGLGLLLAVATAVASVADVPLSGGAGERTWRPVLLSPGETTYGLGAGDAVLDLRDVVLDGRTRRVDVNLGVGELTVFIPDDVTVHIDAHVGAGDIRFFGDAEGGVDVDRSITVGSGEGTLDLDLRAGLAEIEVIR